MLSQQVFVTTVITFSLLISAGLCCTEDHPKSPSVLEPVKIALAPAQAAAPYGGQAIVHALKELATAQDKADDEDDSDKSLDASLQQALEILDATAVSQAAYWDVNITEFARAPTVKVTDSSTGQASTEAGPVTIAGKTISNGYVAPRKSGISDERFFLVQKWSTASKVERSARYQAFVKLVNPGVRRYNVFWHLLEGSTTNGSNSSSLLCPSGYFKAPQNESQRQQQGFNGYHCYNSAQVANLDDYLLRDASYGIESAAIIWGSPPQYRDPGCLGNGRVGKVPCAPRADALWAWNDFAAFLTSRWQGGQKGRFTHFIIWNEADQTTWFDMTPEVNDTQQHIEGTPQQDIYVARYVALMRGAHDAIARNLAGKPSMMYVSTDRMWTATPWCPGPKWGSRCPLGTSNLLNGIWKAINTSIDWSVVVHAYGIPDKSDWKLRQPYQAYTFSDLQYVTQFQQGFLTQYGSPNSGAAPQAFLAAAEQGWDTSTPTLVNVTASYVCKAHAISLNESNHILWVTQNDFQEAYAPYSGAVGIIPLSSGPYLNLTADSPPYQAPTLQAYGATNPSVWGIDAKNYCCITLKLGCPAS